MATLPSSVRGLHSLCKQLQAITLTGFVPPPSLHQAISATYQLCSESVVDTTPSAEAVQPLPESQNGGSMPHEPASGSGRQFDFGESYRLSMFDRPGSSISRGVMMGRYHGLGVLQSREGHVGGVLLERHGARGYATKLWTFTRKRLYGGML